MSAQPTSSERDKTGANRIIAFSCLAFFGAMVGAAYASVPLYKLFCQMTGYGGTTQRVEQASDVILDRPITVRFDANVAGGLPWNFAPEARSVTIKIGETVKAEYKASTTYSKPTRGRASFNVTPELAGSYFNKLECFCFTDTELKPGEELEMPVVFYVDPDIVNVPELKNIQTITLSYTFFPSNEEPEAAAQARAREPLSASIGG